MTISIDDFLARYKTSGDQSTKTWDPPYQLPPVTVRRPPPIGGSSARTTTVKPAQWAASQKTAQERGKIVCKGIKALSREQLLCLQALPIYETMLRNRLEVLVHDSDGDLLEIEDSQCREMRSWLNETCSGFWHEDHQDSQRLTFWFEFDTDMVAFSLRFSGE